MILLSRPAATQPFNNAILPNPSHPTPTSHKHFNIKPHKNKLSDESIRLRPLYHRLVRKEMSFTNVADEA